MSSDIEDILNKLEANLKTKDLPSPGVCYASLPRYPVSNHKKFTMKDWLTSGRKCDEILERLQLNTRSIDDLDPLLERRGIFLLGTDGFDSTSPNTYRIDLRCSSREARHIPSRHRQLRKYLTE